eukprot:3346430-Amphidinium_carterae.1
MHSQQIGQVRMARTRKSRCRLWHWRERLSSAWECGGELPFLRVHPQCCHDRCNEPMCWKASWQLSWEQRFLLGLLTDLWQCHLRKCAAEEI